MQENRSMIPKICDFLLMPIAASAIKQGTPDLFRADYLTFKVAGSIMKSEIIAELLNTLRATGQSGIELVRHLYLAFRQGNSSSSLWYLTRDGMDVVVVYWTKKGSSVDFSILENGELSVKDRLRELRRRVSDFYRSSIR